MPRETKRVTDVDVARLLRGPLKIESLIHAIFTVDGVRYEYRRVDPAYPQDGDPYRIPPRTS